MTAEQQARDLLDRIGVPNAQSYSAGDLVELANLLAFAPQWQPIETAPKDGRRLLLWWPEWCDEPIKGWWADGYWQCIDAVVEEGPTHWMPLPPPPTMRPGSRRRR